MSDGSIVADTERCDFGDPYQDENEDAECVGPAAECGYGYDEHGNPNPSSGELQTQWGCEQGYITDPDLCAAVADL